MKKWVCILLTAILAACAVSASAEKGFETLFELYCSEEVFGQPAAVYDMAEGENEKICLAIYMFDTEYDMTNVILIGADESGVNRYYTWVTDYQPGATTMTFLISRFAELKATCDKDVDFCISYSFDGGQTMTDIATVEDAEALTATLQQNAADMESPQTP
jgi:hypothetical protein